MCVVAPTDIHISNFFRLSLRISREQGRSSGTASKWSALVSFLISCFCRGDGQSMSSCPGSIIEGLHLPAESPHLTRFDTVQWILDDADGFKKFLNDSVGINFDDLVEGEFFVTRLGEPLHILAVKFINSSRRVMYKGTAHKTATSRQYPAHSASRLFDFSQSTGRTF